jgi:hypothetical protein
MAVTVKNPALKRKVFRLMDKYDSEALKAYKAGNMARGRAYEKRSDRAYASNYNKIFKVTRK